MNPVCHSADFFLLHPAPAGFSASAGISRFSDISTAVKYSISKPRRISLYSTVGTKAIVYFMVFISERLAAISLYQKHQIAPFAELSFVMQLSAHDVTGTNSGKGDNIETNPEMPVRKLSRLFFRIFQVSVKI